MLLAELRRDGLHDVLVVQLQRHFDLVRRSCALLERLTTNEVMVELHERAIAEVVRRQVVVVDVVRVVAAAERGVPLEAVRLQPLAVLLHALVA